MTQRALILAVGLILLGSVLAGAVVVNHASCQRTLVTRKGLRVFFTAQADRAKVRAGLEHGTAQVLDLEAQGAAEQAVRVERSGSCSGLFP
jgi:hypothetical protein